jgi:hypothetical protein
MIRSAGRLVFIDFQEPERTRALCGTLGAEPAQGGVMISLMSLGIPILLSSVLVFIASSIIHMMTPLHRSDLGKVPKEDTVQDAMRGFKIPPGDYAIPCPESMEHMRSKEFMDKVHQGPVIYMTVAPNEPVSMGRNLTLWFIYSVVISIFAAYVTSRALSRGADYLAVFRFAGTTAFIAYAMALPQQSIWYSKSWGAPIKTAGTFGWLWPR